MNKKSIAPSVSGVYARPASRQVVGEALLLRSRRFAWRLSVPKLHAIKRGLMHLSLFWRRLAVFAGEIRTQVMVEIERNPLAVRQGAATIMCLAAAAVAMPVISYRAAEQREGAEWTATSTAFRQAFQQNLLQQTDPTARVELTSLRTNGDGLRARGTATLFDSADARALLVSAVLRGPSAPQPAAPVQPSINVREHNCLSEAIYYEARGETQQGQVAVAEVIMNRVHSPFYPKSICAVVYQGSDRDTGCQFTFTCDGSLAAHPRGRAWIQAQHLATAVMSGYTRPITQHATHYHTNAVNPGWSTMLIETTTIGSHVFYRMPNAAERAELTDAAVHRRAPAVSPQEAPLIPPADQAAADAAAAADEDATAPPAAQPAAPATTPASSEHTAEAAHALASPA